MAATVIRNFIAKALFKKKGAIANNKAVNFSANALEQRLKNLGIDPNAITSEKELNQILAYVKQAEDQAFNQRFGEMLGGSKFDRKGEVFDLTGKKINPSKGIMGGKEINEQTLKEGLMKTDNPFSDLVKTTEKGPKTLKEREAEVLAKLEKGNKETVQRIRNRKMVEEAIDNASPGFAGDRKYDAQLVADDLADKRFGKEFYDLDQKQQLDLYDEAYQSLYEKQVFDPPEDFAQGGRAGFANGTPDKKKKNKKITRKEEDIGPYYETNDPEEAIKEIVRRMINVEPAKIPLSKDMQLMFDLNRAQIGGSKNIGGGELNFGINKGFGRDDTGIGFEYIKRFANGGRIGLKDGSGMTRRSFLKILGGLAAIPIVGKFLKPIKTAKGIKSVPIIKTDNVAGKPEWFDALVNKVIIEGDDVTKKFATAERQSIHQKTLNDGSVVRVTEDVDDGAVRVEYQNEANVFGDDVLMQYKKPLPDEGAPNPAAEFTTAESGPVGRSRGPDDYEIELDEIGGSSIEDLDSDVSKLKEYATGKGPTIREIIQNKKRKDKAKRITTDPEAQSDAVIKRQGEFIQFEDIDPNMASGGIARMLGE